MTNRVVVVTGLYGAGKSTALHALEELGYFCIDNLPATVVVDAVEACEASGVDRIALGLHVGRGILHKGVAEVVDSLGVRRRPGDQDTPATGSERDVIVLYFDASDAAVLRRFNETRRPHPMLAKLTGDEPTADGLPGTSAVMDGVRLERERLAPLRSRATFQVDTSNLSVHDLRRRIVDLLGHDARTIPHLETRIVSFGYKYGIPTDANLLFDVRFIDNPYFVPELRPLTGLDEKVRDHVMASEESQAYFDKLADLLTFCLPRYEREGKSYLTIGIGCTGGQHRSVAITEVLADRLRDATNMKVSTVHRDLPRAAHRGERKDDHGSPKGQQGGARGS